MKRKRDVAKPQRSSKELSYGEASQRLQDILETIEEGQVDIDDLSVLVKEAAELVTVCRKKIHAAELQVKTITERLERDAPVTADDEESDG